MSKDDMKYGTTQARHSEDTSTTTRIQHDSYEPTQDSSLDTITTQQSPRFD
ncbi:hypothetical protein MKX01_026667 [Papaver californicum]|nr:hypothetical protein MKX01_026667 [Papaver californicum]